MIIPKAYKQNIFIPTLQYVHVETTLVIEKQQFQHTYTL